MYVSLHRSSVSECWEKLLHRM